MTEQRLLPNLSMTNKWKPGTNGWAVGMDDNIQKMDTLAQLCVWSATFTAPPANPSVGDRYIVARGATGAWAGLDDRVVLWIDGGWFNYAPHAGWICPVLDQDIILVYDGAKWRTPTQPYDIPVWRLAMPTVASEAILSVMIVRKIFFNPNFTGSLAQCAVAPLTDQVLNVCKDSAVVGALTFLAGSYNGTFTTSSPGNLTLAPGDVFEL